MNSNLNKKGYTLTEMLVAVAILIILCAIAIPAMGALRKNLELTKYDDVARQIYLASQNKLTTMKSVGTLDDFFAEVQKEYSTQDLGVLNQQPQDYDGDADGWKKLYYFHQTDDVLENYLIGKDSVLVSSFESGGNFFIELNPETGDVYGVFYAEDTFTYQDVNELYTRNKSDRKEKMIGYYGGISELSANSSLPTEFTPTIKVVNKEDLYLDIECAGMRKLIKTPEKIALTLTVTDESFVPENTEQHSYTLDLKGGKDFKVSNDKVKTQILLDSISGGGESFENITQGKLTPGDNIKVTVSMTYTNDEVMITGSATAETNSLFAAKDDSNNLSIAYVRHLNNLRSSIYDYKGSGGITISQAAPIDYDYNNWDADAIIPEKSGLDQIKDSFENNGNKGKFLPIENSHLFNQITYNGNNNGLLNFDIAGMSNVGLFSILNDCTLQDMRLVNFEVFGNQFVGALAGQILGGSITNCGAYLETRDEYNRPLTDMKMRVARYKIKGTQYVGGLVGRVSGATVTEGSYGAIDVFGSSYVGGFCGEYSGGSILNSYASGNISANNHYAGGFAGRVVNTTINQCYATSNVTAPVFAGGFAGSVTNGSVSNCNSYGIVEKSDGKLDTATSGGFVGKSNSSFHACKFLRQANYNYDYTLHFTGVLPKGFPDLKVSNNLPADSYPYLDELVGNSMPFQLLTGKNGGVIPHYGDWPAELKLQTSLVYYEKYPTADANGSYYGYYAKTSLTATGSEQNTGAVNSWELDTLRDEACVEDGYALMTIYVMSKFTYRLNDDLNLTTKTVEVKVSDTAGENKAVKITDKVSLLFKNTQDGSQYTISNAKVYQLPFSLQMTDRNTAARFYDRLVVAGYVQDEKKFENYMFFYCPDFAKNAINPDINQATLDTPKNPTGEENAISVRSPRHINALARAAYYWNTTKWTDNKDNIQYCFKQENEIDFALYTKKYCGMDYDLMDTTHENLYRNRPIGRPNSQKFTDPNGDTYEPSNFRNSYDGQGYPIIDFCCVTTKADKYQFTGLFGEVQQAVLKNIVMVASDPENKSGYVTSKYDDGSHHAGVGALAGLVYVNKGEEYANGTRSLVTNCSASGYTVSYAPDSNAKQPVAVGGLVGYNFGRIENCSAVSKLVTVEGNSQNVKSFIGGLVGSINGRGSITTCYAGGVVTAEKTGNVNIYLAGICAGFDDIYGAYYTDKMKRNRDQEIENVYTYCTWENGNVSGTPYAVINQQDKMSLAQGYYLTSEVGNKISLQGTYLATPRNFDQMREVSFGSNGTARASGYASSTNTHPWSNKLDSIAYSFPAVVINPRTTPREYIHYGDWYYESTKRDSGYLTYYELYEDDSFACSYINGQEELETVGTFDATNSKIILQAGYGILRLAEDQGAFRVNDTPLTLNTILKMNISVNKGLYHLYSLSDESEKLLLPEEMQKSRKIVFHYEELEDGTRDSTQSTIFVNASYANAIASVALDASSSSPLLVRTAEQLQNMTTAAPEWHISLDHNILATNATGNILNNGYTFHGGYVSGGVEQDYEGYKTGSNGNYILGLTKPLFSTIAGNGSVNNLALIGVDMTTSSEKLAAVAVTNFGEIQNCFATGTIATTTTSLGSGGFIFENSGVIHNCYSNIDLSNSRGEVASFALRNSGTIYNCYALGNVYSAASKAFGFLGDSSYNANVENCYTVADVSGNKQYGFAPSGTAGIQTDSCYWAKDKNINSSITNSAGMSKQLSQMKTVFTTYPWTTSNAGATWGNNMNGDYPYPKISALDHYGDWPLAAGGGKVGVVKLYYDDKDIDGGYYYGWKYIGDYYGDGVLIDLGDMSQMRLRKIDSASAIYKTYAVVFDSTFAENLGNWEAVYKIRRGRREFEIPLSLQSNYPLSNDNGGELTVNVFNVNRSYYELDRITLTNEADGTEYVFVYRNNKFELQQ